MRSTSAILPRAVGAASAALALVVQAAQPIDLQREYETAARQANPAFTGFSPVRGAHFFSATHGSEWSCASCHTSNPAARGRHARTGKDIAPLAPHANSDRFVDAARVEKWFKRNCGDVLNRACTAQEKGDVLAWLLSLE